METSNQYTILESLQSPQDIKTMSFQQLAQLAEEIRSFLIQSVSRTGGHLASNLGVVELTLALFKVLSLPEDGIIWDVGHQSYVHKLLTGRMQQFATLRQFGGMSGFPKSCESPYDIFNTGHSSTSISAALGMTRGAELAGEKSRTVAVIGDGALTGGMAFEALDDAGTYKKNFIVILNDNEMSIAANVGGISRYLTRVRTRPQYHRFKSNLEHAFGMIPVIGQPTVLLLKRIKDSVRRLLMTSTVFDDFGFTYFGPIDGHDLPFLCQVLERAKAINGPVLLHVKTKKGKGYKFAEDKPTDFHGVGVFEIDTGERNGSSTSYASVFGATMAELGGQDERICAVTAAMPDGTGLGTFSKLYPKRFFDVGIAEQHAVTFSAGLAKRGLRPVVAVYSSFLQRAYDQVLHDVCMQNLPVTFCIDRAGLVGEDGETHHGIYDLAYLSQMPNMTILAPANFIEFKDMLSYATMVHRGPIAIRYPRGGTSFETGKKFVPNLPEVVTEGKDVAIISVGHMLSSVVAAKEILEKNGVSVSVVNMRTIWPISPQFIKSVADAHKLLVTVEDGVRHGGFGEKVASYVSGQAPVLIKAHDSGIVTHGNRDKLYELCGLDAETIANDIITKLRQA
ncbi:MAG: 1-deoxy-D-xylulose-5-phosphate synthase [Ruminococcaceae bacterium]|nr:1-deoxy-D-xylulose-5-phosphate synthase [Oscillospiraceae bacterium]